MEEQVRWRGRWVNQSWVFECDVSDDEGEDHDSAVVVPLVREMRR